MICHDLALVVSRSTTPVLLDDLFDFSRVDWVPHHQRTSRRSLDDKLEVYNLLDADLPGEEGNEVGIDDTAGEILTLSVGRLSTIQQGIYMIHLQYKAVSRRLSLPLRRVQGVRTKCRQKV